MPFSDKTKAQKKAETKRDADSCPDHLRLIKGDSKNRKSLTKTSDTSLKEELVNVIDLMGPTTPHFKSTSEDECHSHNTAFLLQAEKDESVFIKKKDISSSLNTPRDVSELSSIPTDTVEVFMSGNPTCGPQSNKILSCSKKEPQFSPMNKLGQFLGFKTESKENKEPLDLYTINILQPKNENQPPRKVEFALVTEIPKPNQCNVATNTRSDFFFAKQCSKTKVPTNHNCYCKPQGPNITRHDVPKPCSQTHYYNLKEQKSNSNVKDVTRVDVYYFDHGNSAYYHTTDSPPVIMAEILAEKTESYTTRFWAEVFGAIHIAFSFFTSFILQLIRFVLQSLLRPLTVGVLQLGSDYFLKPLLATLFNSVVQPPLIFIYNVATSLRDICDPIAEGLGYFIRELAALFRSIRLVDIRKEVKCSCNKKEVKCLCHEQGVKCLCHEQEVKCSCND